MEKNSDDLKIKEHISKICNPIFNKALQEKSKTHSMVVTTNKKNITPSLYNPHNYRLYFKFTKEKYNPVQGMVGVWFGKFVNYGKEFTATGEGVRITIRKTQAEVINKLSEEQWFSINRAKAKEEVYAILNKIDDKCIQSLKKFSEQYGGSTDFIILKREHRALFNNLNTKSDNKVMQEPFIDELPLDMTFETPIVKKVYKKPNVEFSEPSYAINYLENSALHEFSPEITEQLLLLEQKVKQIDKASEVLIPLAKQIELHLEVEKRQLENQEKMNELLKALSNKISKEKKKKALSLSQTELRRFL